MIQITAAIRFRLSASQMFIIWPGLDLVFKSFIGYQNKGSSPYSYPFRVYPPSGRFNRGAPTNAMMAKMVALWKRLNPRAKIGGRVEMDTIELRTLIFTTRANLDFARFRRNIHQSAGQRAKSLLQIDDVSMERLKARSKRVILTLERHLKRANRASQKSMPQSAYAKLMRDWRANLRWMRVNIAYFKTSPPVVVGRKVQQQKYLDELMQMATHAIRHEGFQPPDATELRRMMRLFARSARRDREGEYTVALILKRRLFYSANRHLADFVLDRLELKELSDL